MVSPRPGRHAISRRYVGDGRLGYAMRSHARAENGGPASMGDDLWAPNPSPLSGRSRTPGHLAAGRDNRRSRGSARVPVCATRSAGLAREAPSGELMTVQLASDRRHAIDLDVEAAVPGRDIDEDPRRRVVGKEAPIDLVDGGEHVDRSDIHIHLEHVVEG
jgi:hypothetical protein